MKALLKTLLWILIVIVLIFAGLILYGTISDYKPDDQIVLKESQDAVPIQMDSCLQLDLMIWNIGYCGLDKAMDFFYDGGKQVRPTEEQVLVNFEQVKRFIKSNDSLDFILIQEMDKKSKRSYRINEYDSISILLDEHQPSFGCNYKVFFVPLPPTSPMGKVHSGVASFSKYEALKTTRHSFPGNYSWPMGIFMLDRCFLVNRYPLSNEKELLVINTHNSAYDDGSLREAQMKFLKDFLIAEYQKGNYIIVGGDWNQSPFSMPQAFDDFIFDKDNYTGIEKDYLPENWTWLYDSKTPTNRRLLTSYDKNTTTTTVIDFYLLSPNIEGVSVETINLEFAHSDHHPVIASVKIKP